MKNLLFITLLVAFAMIFNFNTTSAQVLCKDGTHVVNSSLDSDTTAAFLGTMRHNREKLEKRLDALEKELAALKAGGTGARTSPCPPTTAPSVTINLDSAAYAKLLDTLRKMGDKRWVNMPGFKNGVFAKLQARIDSLVNEGLSLSDEYATDLASLTERVDKHAIRLSNAEDVIIGLNNKTDGNSDRISNLEIVVASEAFSDEVDTDDFNEVQRTAYEKICAAASERHQKECTGEHCRYKGCKKSQ